MTARTAHRHPLVEGLARLGIAARGLVWLVISGLAAQIALGRTAQADQEGALRALRAQPLGEGLLVVLAVGFGGYAVALAVSAADGGKARDRLRAGGKAVVYAGLGAATARFLLQGGSGGDPAPSLTARALQQPGGRWAVGLAGLAVLAVGAVLLWRALRGSHEDRIRGWRLPRGTSRPVLALGVVGHVGRAAVLGLVGGFVLLAAVRADPREARGLDAALQELAQQPHGRLLLALTVLGLLAYALWSFVEAALHRPGE